MRATRSEIVDAFAHDEDWSVTADERRITFVRADPHQVIIWTVSDSELAQLRHVAKGGGHGAGMTGNGLGLLFIHVQEAIESFHGERGMMHGADLAIIE